MNKIDQEHNSQKKNILVSFRGGIGDFIMLTPLLRALKQSGHFNVYLIGVKGHQALFESCRWIDQVIYFNCPGPEQLGRYIFQRMSLYFYLRKLNFEVCISSVSTYGTIPGLIVDYSRARVSVGFDHGRATDQYEHCLKIDSSKHDIDLNLEVLDVIGLDKGARNTDFVISSDAVGQVNDYFVSQKFSEKKWVALAPLAKGMQGYASKAWFLERYVQLIDRLLRELDVNVMLLGSPSEVAFLERRPELEKFFVGNRIYLNKNFSTLLDAAALLKKAELLICNDGGMMHIAAAIDIPVVALWGPTSPVRWGYRHKENCRMVSKNICECQREYGKGPVKCQSNQKCLDKISVDEVYQACQELFSK